MVDTVKISDLNIVSTIANEDLFVVVDQTGPYSNSITRANLVSSLASEFVYGNATDNGEINIRVNDADFIISDATDGTTNYFWRDHGEGTLMIGTTDAVITPRSDIIPDTDSSRSLGNSTRYFSSAYIDNGYFSDDTGIGTDSPSYRLDVVDTASGIIARVKNGDSGGTPSTTHGEFVVESDNANMGIQLLGTNTSDQRVLFGDSDSNATGAIAYNHTGNYMAFRVSSAETCRIDSSGNFLLGGTATPTSADSTLAIFNGTAPSASVTNGVVLYAEDVSASSELKVRDEAGNITTLSPHNFELIPEGPSEDLAWSYYSERDGKRINVDMLKAIRVLEQLSGTKLVYEG